MECTAAVWDALEVAKTGSVDHAIAAATAYRQVVAHYLINRDHRGVVVASKSPDPLDLSNDPMWRSQLSVAAELLAQLNSGMDGSHDSVEAIKARARDATADEVTEAIVALSDQLSDSAS